MIRVDGSCAPREHYSEYFDEFSHHLFAQHGHEFSARGGDPASFGNLLRNPRPVGSLIAGGPTFWDGATYQHLFQRNGIHHVLDVAVRDDAGPLAILGIFREESAPAFTEAEVRTVNEIYPSLVHAFRAPALPARFDELDSAILVTDVQGQIEWASPSARAWLEDASGGHERATLMDRGVLPAACRLLVQRLSSGGSPTMTLPLAGGRLRLRAYGLTPFTAALQGAPVAIELRLEMHHTLKVLSALEASRLSPRQCHLALGYLQGKTPAELADDLGLAPSTLKSYQRDLYARLDVNTREELIQWVEAQASAATFDLTRHRPRVSRALTMG